MTSPDTWGSRTASTSPSALPGERPELRLRGRRLSGDSEHDVLHDLAGGRNGEVEEAREVAVTVEPGVHPGARDDRARAVDRQVRRIGERALTADRAPQLGPVARRGEVSLSGVRG